MSFLQWALPRLRMRWAGFRKVRRQVCKRIQRRLHQLDLADVAAYQGYLQNQPGEWDVLDGLCRVTVSRFYRDQEVFDFVCQDVLPALAQTAIDRGQDTLKAWSAGCGAGEEPYTLSLLWKLQLQAQFPGLVMQILGTDVDENMITRAQTACYPVGSLKELPVPWRARAFIEEHGGYRLRLEYRDDVEFQCEDVRISWPGGPFDLILCRNLAFTYFDESLQVQIVNHLGARLRVGGALVLGANEKLVPGCVTLEPWWGRREIYKKSSARPQ